MKKYEVEFCPQLALVLPSAVRPKNTKPLSLGFSSFLAAAFGFTLALGAIFFPQSLHPQPFKVAN